MLRGFDFVDGDFAVHNMEPEEVPLDLEVLRSTSDSLVGREEKGTVVVLEDTASNRAGNCLVHTDPGDKFNEQRSDWEDVAHGLAQRGVLSF